MTQPTTPLEVALAFTKAWTRRDFTAAASYLDEDIVFDGPLQQSKGIEPYLDGLEKLAQAVTDIRLIAAFGDEDKAVLMYDLLTTPYGTLTCAKCLGVRDGKIRSDKLAFDSYKVRQAQAAAQTSPAPKGKPKAKAPH